MIIHNPANAIAVVTLLCFLVVLCLVGILHKDDDIVHGAISYGRPLKVMGGCKESMFQVIMVTKARLEDKKDHNVVYGALGEELIYIKDISEEIMCNLIYGKFYNCNIFYGDKEQIDYVELLEV